MVPEDFLALPEDCLEVPDDCLGLRLDPLDKGLDRLKMRSGVLAVRQDRLDMGLSRLEVCSGVLKVREGRLRPDADFPEVESNRLMEAIPCLSQSCTHTGLVRGGKESTEGFFESKGKEKNAPLWRGAWETSLRNRQWTLLRRFLNRHR